MIKEDLVLVAQRNAKQYSRKVARERKVKKMRKAVLGTFLAAFFIASCGIVGKNDLESEGIVIAKETESEPLTVTHTRNGNVFYKDTIETEEGYLWGYETEIPEGTEVTVLFNDNGTTNPLDDIVLDVIKKYGGK